MTEQQEQAPDPQGTGMDSRPVQGRMWGRWLPLVVAAVFLGLWVQAILRPSERIPDSPLIGREAPEFDLERLGGDGRLRLSELWADGKPVFINFWASWCTVCIEEAQDLEDFWQTHRDRIELVGIAVQDAPRDALRFARRWNMNYPLALDPRGRIGIDWGMHGVPETFVVDGKGVVRQRFVGVVTRSQLEAALAALTLASGGPS